MLSKLTYYSEIMAFERKYDAKLASTNVKLFYILKLLPIFSMLKKAT